VKASLPLTAAQNEVVGHETAASKSPPLLPEPTRAGLDHRWFAYVNADPALSAAMQKDEDGQERPERAASGSIRTGFDHLAAIEEVPAPVALVEAAVPFVGVAEEQDPRTTAAPTTTRATYARLLLSLHPTITPTLASWLGPDGMVCR
jgi:hypothetical protein